MTQATCHQKQRHDTILGESEAEKALFSLYKHALVINCIDFKDRKGLLALSSLASQTALKQARISHMAQLLELSSVLALKLNPVAKINNVFIFASCSKMGFPEFQLLV